MKQKIIPGRLTPDWSATPSTPEEAETRYQEWDEDVEAIRDAVLRQLAAGNDVGELVRRGILEAQKGVAAGYTVLDNSPGSPEDASLLPIIESLFQAREIEATGKPSRPADGLDE